MVNEHVGSIGDLGRQIGADNAASGSWRAYEPRVMVLEPGWWADV
jgi:hypothetical protein